MRAGDKVLCGQAMKTLDVRVYFGWRRAMRAVANVPAPEDFRAWFLQVWVRSGDHISSEDDDCVLMDALWSLLPRYSGGKLITLYSLWNRRRRSNGLSWTEDSEVARSFADGPYRTFEGGSVLLRTVAPAKAIICAPALKAIRVVCHG